MAHFEMFTRDAERLADCRRRVNRLPLGAAALAGTGFPIDRESVARELGFEGLCENSIDAVSDRDFAIEFLDAAATLRDVLTLLAELLKGVEPRPDRMRAALREGFATATDLADYLVRKGMAFRDAHEAVARAVRAAEKAGKDLSELTAAELKAVSPLIGEDVRAVLTPEGSVALRGGIGGTAPEAVRAAIARGRERLKGLSEAVPGTDSELPP